MRSPSLMRSVVGTVAGFGAAVSSKASQTGQALVKTSANLGGTIGRTASQTSRSVWKVATGFSNVVFKQGHHWAEQATAGTGQAVTYVSDNPMIRRLTKALKLDWLVSISDQVDLAKAEAVVHKLQQAHPNEAPSQTAHRIMLEKAIYAGSVGLASSLVPGGAIALLAVDLATTSKLQTEMLYQIAAAYGLTLNDPARKGEVIAIFGLALGGSRAVRTGLVFVKNVPLAGALIGASANATILYALGYAACRFYEAKLDPEVAETATETLQDIKQKSDSYLEVAIAQQAIMDQVLAHMLLASYPEKAWEDILPNLQSLGLHPNSLQAIANHLQAPQPLGALLDQLNRDFAVLTLSRCDTIAQLDDQVSAAETKVLTAISEKFDLDLNTLKARLSTTDSALDQE
ncbi:hypothetical protein H6F86_29405 [Phormidium sp. FACHB-592]|nr:hypothetical protein [Phormidium sp. FACHB-592]